LGFTVGFLARVKPQLLCGYRPPARRAPSPALASLPVEKIVALVFAPLVLLAFVGPALAHRLEAAYRVLPDRRVEIESWFDIPGENGDTPRGAKVQVFHADGSLLTEGVMDSRGLFLFGFEKAEPLRVVVNAGQGHAKELKIPKDELEKLTSPDPTTPD